MKVLDFGLAKALSPDGRGESPDAMNSPTLTAHATRLGIILGTAAYMAPEQAKGSRAVLMIKAVGTEQAPSMVVVLNWLEELKAKLPAK